MMIILNILMLKGALQLLINRYGLIRFAHVPERVSTKSFVVLSIGNTISNHLGAQGTFNLIGIFWLSCMNHLHARGRVRQIEGVVGASLKGALQLLSTRYT